MFLYPSQEKNLGNVGGNGLNQGHFYARTLYIPRNIFATWKKISDYSRQCIKKQSCHFANKGLSSQSYDFFSSHV